MSYVQLFLCVHRQRVCVISYGAIVPPGHSIDGTIRVALAQIGFCLNDTKLYSSSSFFVNSHIEFYLLMFSAKPDVHSEGRASDFFVDVVDASSHCPDTGYQEASIKLLFLFLRNSVCESHP